jgi:hypothetical protein
MSIDTQTHPVETGLIEISRANVGRGHRYSVEGITRMPSVTTIAKHVEGDTFGIGVNWAAKLIRETGDPNAPRDHTRAAMLEGERLHDEIRQYIENGTVAEDSPMFVTWLNMASKLDVGKGVQFIQAERYLYHPELQYGGTCDAISQDTYGQCSLWDWKTKDRASFEKQGSTGYIKDDVQLAAYAHALRSMKSLWAPSRAYVCYIMRDGSYGVHREVDIERSMKLFVGSWNIYKLLEEEG